MRELAEVSRPEALPISGPAFSAETAAVVRAWLGGAIPEMIEAIARGVPSYAAQARPDYQQRLADAVTGTGPEPCLLVPDPDGPGRQAAIDRVLSGRALGGRAAAIGPGQAQLGALGVLSRQCSGRRLDVGRSSLGSATAVADRG